MSILQARKRVAYPKITITWWCKSITKILTWINANCWESTFSSSTDGTCSTYMCCCVTRFILSCMKCWLCSNFWSLSKSAIFCRINFLIQNTINIQLLQLYSKISILNSFYSTYEDQIYNFNVAFHVRNIYRVCL